jgi:predicted dehydrogenase
MGRTAGAAGAVVVGKSILLEASPMPRPGTPSKVRFGMIGVGMRGSGLMRTSIGLPGVECAMACDLWDGRVELAKQIGGPDLPTTKRYQDILDRKDVDCIVAAVPDHWHKRIVVDAVSAGKDVYVEKPMTHEVSEGFEIIQAASAHNRIVQCGSQEPSSVVYQKAKALLADGGIGQLSLVEATMGRNSHCGAWWYTVPPDLSPATLDWDTWLGSTPKIPFDGGRWAHWRGYSAYGEGIPGDLFIHHLTGIHYVLGLNDPPRRAFSQGGIYRWKDGRDQPDVITTVYDYPNFSLTLRVTLNTITESGFRFMGDRGIMTINGVENPTGLSFSPQDGRNHSPCTPGWPRDMASEYAKKWFVEHDPRPGAAKAVEVTNFDAPHGYNDTREHLWNFFQSVKTRAASVEGPEFANACAIACHMANHSYFNRCVAEWDAGNRTIVKA